MLHIRPAMPEDARLLSEMGRTSYPYYFAHLWQNPQELADFVQQEYDPQAIAATLSRSRWLLATWDGAPVGFAKLSLHQAAAVGTIAGTLLHKLYLMPEQTGKGIGEALFQAAEREAKAGGDRCLWLEVLVDNPRARRFYERQGMHYAGATQFTSATQTSVLHILAKML
ncbi:GNAT family N-acetyltransferase [uncultured Pluralibacter sp.]|uniref:GNAT family N-acetyltransferase n=1 Tax=uncultured Pluralibacter sp. TaxID=1490864 RepID=UPI00261E6A33|nr:GNAT family N-acetyltransferase [uncultured Pluralibacter sp.]